MKIGPLELSLHEQADGSWRYDICNTRDPEQKTHGFRPKENEARQAGLEDAFLMRAHCH